MKTKKEIKKEMKNLMKKINNSSLNRFIISYYLSLKFEEIDDSRDAVKYKINFHNRLIKDLKKELKTSKNNQKDFKNIKDYIGELEYSNDTSIEIIKLLDARKSYFKLKNQLKNQPKKFKNKIKKY